MKNLIISLFVVGCAVPALPDEQQDGDAWASEDLRREMEIFNTTILEWSEVRGWPDTCPAMAESVTIWRASNRETFGRHCPSNALACSYAQSGTIYLPAYAPIEGQESFLVHELLHMWAACACESGDADHSLSGVWDTRNAYPQSLERRIKARLNIR